jgi:hypothetical protein
MTSQISLQVTHDLYNGFMSHARENDTMHVLLEDDLGRLTLRRLRPWDRIMARCLATRLDRELARGARPETNVGLAARAVRLTSMKSRRDLAESLQRILAAGDRRRQIRRFASLVTRTSQSVGTGSAGQLRSSRSWPPISRSPARSPRAGWRWYASC